jgi:hypothetical protein
MRDNPIGVADRRKRIAWGVLIRADDAAVIGGGKTLEGLVRDKNRWCALEWRVEIGIHHRPLVYLEVASSLF